METIEGYLSGHSTIADDDLNVEDVTILGSGVATVKVSGIESKYCRSFIKMCKVFEMNQITIYEGTTSITLFNSFYCLKYRGLHWYFRMKYSGDFKCIGTELGLHIYVL